MYKKGFTVVELIVVVTVLVILALITLVAYSFWQTDTAKNTLTYDLKAAATTMEQERNFTGSFPSSVPNSYLPSKKSTLTVVSADNTNFCIRGTTETDTALIMRFRKSEGEPRVGDC